MCQCHTMCQSEGDMQVQVAHSKKIPLGEKKFLHGVPAFFSGGTPGAGGGGTKKNSREFFSTPPPPVHRAMHPCQSSLVSFHLHASRTTSVTTLVDHGSMFPLMRGLLQPTWLPCVNTDVGHPNGSFISMSFPCSIVHTHRGGQGGKYPRFSCGVRPLGGLGTIGSSWWAGFENGWPCWHHLVLIALGGIGRHSVCTRPRHFDKTRSNSAPVRLRRYGGTGHFSRP